MRKDLTEGTKTKDLAARIDFSKLSGLIPAIVQDYHTGAVLMLGFMNSEALNLTIQTGYVHFFSRTRNSIWKKGETSGNHLLVKSLVDDCDNDTVLVRAIPEGPTCHTGAKTCFNSPQSLIEELSLTIKDRKISPKDGSYTSSLFKDGIKRLAQKVGEEGVEVAIAALVEDREKLVEESADLVFHLMTLLEERGVNFTDVVMQLAKRR